MSVSVVSREQLTKILEDCGCTKIGETTRTGEFWIGADGKHFQVPVPPHGGYPDWMVDDLLVQCGCPPDWMNN